MRQATWQARLTNPDSVVVLDALNDADADADPSLDCSLAASHPDPLVRLTAAALWSSLDDTARSVLRTDTDEEVAAAASPALSCRVFVSRQDADEHAQMLGAELMADDRLTVALGTLGRRTTRGELEHVSCVLAAVDTVAAALGPDDTRLAERAATVGAAAVRSAGFRVSDPAAVERLVTLGRRLSGDAAEAWHYRLIALSTRLADRDWDGSLERAARRSSQARAAQEREWDEQRRESNRVASDLENELAERIRRGEYPALWKDRPRQTPRQTGHPGPKRRPPGF
ncbi:MAG: hypothetical protein ACKO04_12380 [Actinomycetes bacterium]